mmetsp:Transcript_37730/g.84081  ORF Transcript_37730/g.84081 Transcript_37730/m.84081 type:complete len:142 (-) Transcript_37730:1524-1949(-)
MEHIIMATHNHGNRCVPVHSGGNMATQAAWHHGNGRIHIHGSRCSLHSWMMSITVAHTLQLTRARCNRPLVMCCMCALHCPMNHEFESTLWWDMFQPRQAAEHPPTSPTQGRKYMCGTVTRGFNAVHWKAAVGTPQNTTKQ